MPKITDTYQLAYACCETVLKELNRFPTIDLIRERIGVNSPNTIKKAMNDWTEAFVKQYIEQQQATIAFPEVPAVLNDAVYQLWKRSVNEAEQLANIKAEALKAQLDELQQTIDHYKTDCLALQQALQNETNKLTATEKQLATLNLEHQLTLTELLETQQREQALANALEEQSKREQALMEQHAERLQQDQTWMQRRILEERELAAEKWQAKYLQQEERLAFLKAQAEQALQSQTLLQTQNQQLLAEIKQLKTQQISDSVPLKRSQRFKAHQKLK
jgi:hypothetical protein